MVQGIDRKLVHECSLVVLPSSFFVAVQIESFSGKFFYRVVFLLGLFIRQIFKSLKLPSHHDLNQLQHILVLAIKFLHYSRFCIGFFYRKYRKLQACPPVKAGSLIGIWVFFAICSQVITNSLNMLSNLIEWNLHLTRMLLYKMGPKLGYVFGHGNKVLHGFDSGV